MPQTLDFAAWNLTSVAIGRRKLGIDELASTSIVIGGLAAEAAARIAGDNANAAALIAEIAARIAGDAFLQAQINALGSLVEVSCGTLALGNGVDAGTVAGLGLSFTPSRVLLTIEKPLGGLNLFADVVDPPTTDGFDFTLSGLTDNANYMLHYMAVPPVMAGTGPKTFTVGGVSIQHGVYTLLSGTDFGAVTGLALGFTPTQVFVSLRKPVGGLHLSAIVNGPPTSDGFDFTLSGLTDDVDYKLDYMIIHPTGNIGTLALGNGVDSGSVTGLGLSFVPSSVLVSVIIPVGGLNISASVTGTPTADGFNFTLSGLTDSANYKLYYMLLL